MRVPNAVVPNAEPPTWALPTVADRIAVIRNVAIHAAAPNVVPSVALTAAVPILATRSAAIRAVAPNAVRLEARGVTRVAPTSALISVPLAEPRVAAP